MRRAWLILGACAATAHAGWLLLPMDEAQTDHLRAYGVCWAALHAGAKAEWLLNYRGGSFLLEDYEGLSALCGSRGVAAEYVADPAPLYDVIEANNMEAVPLTKAPRVALYAPPYEEEWDDAVKLVLEYAAIPYERVWNAEVLAGTISQYDWLYLHHEDFTGQLGKFNVSFAGTPWYETLQARYEAEARAAGYASVPAYESDVAEGIARYVQGGGFIFAMCSATDTLDIALAARGVDIVDAYYDGTPADPDADGRLNFDRTLAFRDFKTVPDPYTYEFSDIDSPRSIQPADETRKGSFTLFAFSAKADTIPCLLTQDHVARITEFMGQTTAFTRATIKKNVVVLATVDGYDEAKYVYGNYGEGFFSFLGGHDPEDYQHFVGETPTDVSRFPHSPGYRLILDNLLFPAARREELKT